MRRLIIILAFITTLASSLKAQDCSAKTVFTWGAEAGGLVDMSSHDMSAITIDAMFGVRHGWLHTIGAGASISMMINNSYRSYPIYVNIRTNFSDRPTRAFLDARGGVVINEIDENHRTAGAYASGGVGIKLAQSSTFSSHIILAYTFMQRGNINVGSSFEEHLPSIHCATLRFGVNF